jgi:hypothetical protein
MKTTVTIYDFMDKMNKIRTDNFSKNGQRALFEYLENLESEIGQEIECDIIAICSDYCEYKSIKQAMKEHNDKERLVENIVATFKGGIIVRNY